jgi:hypothetical protein
MFFTAKIEESESKLKESGDKVKETSDLLICLPLLIKKRSPQLHLTGF